jgi:hypothetical protein
MPRQFFSGYCDRIDINGKRLTETSTPILRAINIKVRSLGTGTYIAIGTEDNREFRLNNIDDSIEIDFVDDLKKIHAITDIGSTGELEWIGA